MVREGPAQPAPPHKEDAPKVYPAEKARGGEIILRTRLRKYIFFGGLIGIVALLFVLLLLRA